MEYVAAMVTRIRQSAVKRLYLYEHRKAKNVSPPVMAGRLGVERESVHRIERRRDPKWQERWAAALGIEPEELWHPPGRTSLDAMVADASPELRNTIEDVVRRLVAGSR
jgi:hypothetical protein